MLLRDVPGPVFYAVAAVVGLAWSGLVTQAVDRLPRDIRLLRPAPFCPKCEAPLRGLDLVPIVPFFAFRARARCCGARRDLSPLLIEITSVALAVALVPVTAQSLGPFVPLHEAALVYLATTAVALGLVAAAFIDARHAYIPDPLTLGGAVLGVGTAAFRGMDLTDSLVGGCTAFFVTALPLVYAPRLLELRPGIGLGDAKLMILAGAWLGTRGALLALGLGAVQGLVVLAIARAAGKKILVPEEVAEEIGPLPALPFGPFIVLGILERMFLGRRLDGIVTFRAPW